MPQTCYWTSTSSGTFTLGANWSTTTAPAAGDTVIISNSAVDISAAALSSTTLASLTVDATYTGKIGSASGSLAISSTATYVGEQPGHATASGSARIHLGGDHATANVYSTASSATDAGLPPVVFTGGTITNLNVSGGNVGVGLLLPTDTATVTTVRVTKGSATGVTPVVTLGPNVATGTVVGDGTVSVVNKRTTGTVAAATATNGAQYVSTGDAAHTTVNASANGVVRYQGTGTLANLAVYDATAYLNDRPAAKTVTNCDVYKDAKVYAAGGNVTFTNGITLNGCDLDDVDLTLGNDKTLTVS